MRILIVDDCADFRRTTRALLIEMGHECSTEDVCSEALSILSRESFDVLFFDLDLVDRRGEGLELLPHFLAVDNQLALIAIGKVSCVNRAESALHAGAADYLAKPVARGRLEDCLKRIQKKRANRIHSRTEDAPGIRNAGNNMGIETQVPCMRSACSLAARAAPTPTTLLLLGESGTGKTTLARAIHLQSREARGPFVTVNCPSLSKELFESDLFGHIRGAFTGAVRDKLGKVAQASGGTLFLDEIGELPFEMQAKLLRLIQEREFERVGDPTTLRAHVRVIAATNKDLADAVASGCFREDLYYRLNVVPIQVPALRHRVADIPAVARALVETLCLEMSKPVMTISESALQAMNLYSWPGNLRELRNALEHALIMANGASIEVMDLPSSLCGQGQFIEACQVGSMVSLETLERAQIEHVIEATSTREEAASVLGIDPATLYRKRKRYAQTYSAKAC